MVPWTCIKVFNCWGGFDVFLNEPDVELVEIETLLTL